MTATDAPGIAFVDTNVLVYAFAPDDSHRSPLAARLLEQLMGNHWFRTSTQVLQELFVTLTRKGQRPMRPERAIHFLDHVAAFPVVTTDYKMIRDAAALSAQERLSFWDGLVIVSAVRSGAQILYSEDLQHGRTIRGLKILIPFRI